MDIRFVAIYLQKLGIVRVYIYIYKIHLFALFRIKLF